MAQSGGAHSPFRDGFAALLHEPALMAAELTWRWCFGISALLLGIFSVGFFLNSLKITAAERLLLRSWIPSLWPIALRHVFAGSLSRLLLEVLVLSVGLTLLGSFSIAAGRSAILLRLTAMFRTGEEPEQANGSLATIFILQLLRVAVRFMAVTLCCGLFLYGMAMVHEHHAMRAAIALSFGIGLVCAIGSIARSCLSLAPIFCVRNGAGIAESVDQAFAFSMRQGGRLFWMGFGFFALRMVWAGALWLAILAPLQLIRHVDKGWVALLMAFALLVFFAGDDLLELARLAAHVSLAEDDAHEPPAPLPVIMPDSYGGLDPEPIAGLA